MGIDRRIIMSRVMNGEWSPRAMMHEFVKVAKSRGATMVLLGRLMEISKQAIAQWLVEIEKPAIHIERHALDYLIKISETPENERPSLIADLFVQVTKILEKASAMEPIPVIDSISLVTGESFTTIQIWAPNDLLKRVDEVAKVNFGCKKFFFSWAIREFTERKIFATPSFVFRQPRVLKKDGKEGGMLYVQIDHSMNDICRTEAKRQDVSLSAYLMESIAWGASQIGGLNA